MLSRMSQGALVWLVMVCLQAVWAGYERNCDYHQPPSPMGKCGKQLADLVDTVCMFYYGGKKRSSGAPMMHTTKPMSTWPIEEETTMDTNIFMPKHKAVALLQNNKRGMTKGRITCECCQYQCDIHELSQYCSVSVFAKRSVTSLNDIIHHVPPESHREGQHRTSKAHSDVRDKQKIGELLRKYGPRWLESYLVYQQAQDEARLQANMHDVMMEDDSDGMREDNDGMHLTNDDYIE